jgi:hypothetical protein
VHIRICAGGCNAVDGPKDKIAVELFFSTGLAFMFLEGRIKTSKDTTTIANLKIIEFIVFHHDKSVWNLID